MMYYLKNIYILFLLQSFQLFCEIDAKDLNYDKNRTWRMRIGKILKLHKFSIYLNFLFGISFNILVLNAKLMSYYDNKN